jgi:7-keto-8-aminopelargonate synthetase-like enzyme
VVTSLAKAFAAGGAVLVFPDAETARLVRACGSSLIFSGPLQPPLIGAGLASARIHLSAEINERQARVLERIRLFNRLAEARGVPVASKAETPIRFVGIGDNPATYRVAGELMKQGFYANTAVFPAVTAGKGGLRIALTVHQTLSDIRDLVDEIARRL